VEKETFVVSQKSMKDPEKRRKKEIKLHCSVQRKNEKDFCQDSKR